MPRVRTFIAVELSPRVITRSQQLIDLLKPSAGKVSWTKPAQMHLTLKFLGDVQDTETPDICRVVSRVAGRFEPFEIVCRGAGAFPNLGNPRTLWIGIEHGAKELCELQAAIEDALKSELGFPKEQRRFQPHLTIGRVKQHNGAAELGAALKEHADFDVDLSVIDEVVVFASFLGRGGPTHEALGHAPLAG